MNESKLIDELGGNAVVARLCDVSWSAVYQWRKSGIPRARLMYLKVVRPDVFRLDRNPKNSNTKKPVFALPQVGAGTTATKKRKKPALLT